MIKEVNKSDVSECVKVIRSSFMTIAEQFGFTIEMLQDLRPLLRQKKDFYINWTTSQDSCLDILIPTEK